MSSGRLIEADMPGWMKKCEEALAVSEQAGNDDVAKRDRTIRWIKFILPEIASELLESGEWQKAWLKITDRYALGVIDYTCVFLRLRDVVTGHDVKIEGLADIPRAIKRLASLDAEEYRPKNKFTIWDWWKGKGK